LNLNKSWLKNVTTKFHTIFSKIFSISEGQSLQQSKWKVRLANVRSAASLSLSCTKTLGASMHLFLDVLVLHIHDDYVEVSHEARVALKNLTGKLSIQTVALVKENLHNVLVSLPRHVRRSLDLEILRNLRLIIGYICLLGNRTEIDTFLRASLDQISLALLQSLEFDIYDIRKVESSQPVLTQAPKDPKEQKPVSENFATTLVVHDSGSLGYPQSTFKYFRDDRVIASMCKICRLLGYYGDLTMLMDHFLSILRDPEAKLYHKQAVFVLNQMVLGTNKSGIEFEVSIKSILSEHETIVEETQLSVDTASFVIEEYFAENIWNCPTFNSPANSVQLTIEEIHNNVLLQCLLLEGIGKIAETLGSNFDPLLIKTLYNITEKLGDSNNEISQSAWATIQRMSKAGNYPNVASLIAQNTLSHRYYLPSFKTSSRLSIDSPSSKRNSSICR